MYQRGLFNIRTKKPKILCISNGNMSDYTNPSISALGARVIQTMEIGEVDELAKKTDCLCLSLASFDGKAFELMERAMEDMKKEGKPTICYPRGIDLSDFRLRKFLALQGEYGFTSIIGSSSEMRALARASYVRASVEVPEMNMANSRSNDFRSGFLKKLAGEFDTALVMVDFSTLIADGEKCLTIRNGRKETEEIFGINAQFLGVAASFLAANPYPPVDCLAQAVSIYQLAVERAYKRLEDGDGEEILKLRIVDSLSKMTGLEHDREIKCEIS